MTDQGHPIEIDLDRVLSILAREIHTSPFAFIRENVQNAFDAVRVQLFRERKIGHIGQHTITITLEGNLLSIRDSGIGMTREDLAKFFWSIGRSGKHTEEARSAGVVGTFGIGGMANFGICSRVEVVTKTHSASESVACFAERKQLSAKRDCVFYGVGPSDFDPGTRITGTITTDISIAQVSSYLQPIVRFLDVPVQIAGKLISKQEFPSVHRDHGSLIDVKNGSLIARIWVRAERNGRTEIEVVSAAWKGEAIDIRGVLNNRDRGLWAYQHGFMLAQVPLTSVFGLGGVVDSPVLRSTAGREAVTDESRTLMQNLIGAIESGIALYISRDETLPDCFSSYYRYVVQTEKWNLVGTSTVRVHGSENRIRLDSLKDSPKDRIFFARTGYDPAVGQTYLDQKKTVVVLSTDPSRAQVERRYIELYCNGVQLDDSITCFRLTETLSMPEEALKYQLLNKLNRQFLIAGLHVIAGELSHGAMLWSPREEVGKDKVLFVDFRHPNIQRLLALRGRLSFDSILDVFIRDSILPHLETSFPELRRRDFDALLRMVQSTVEYYQIDPRDVGRIRELAHITRSSPEVVAATLGGRSIGSPIFTSVSTRDVVIVSERINLALFQIKPNVTDGLRQQVSTLMLDLEIDAKILSAVDVAPDFGLSGYYLAFAADANLLYRRIFLERSPSTDFSWGGHRAGYLFYSVGSAVIYYDIQFEELIGETELHKRTGMLSIEKAPLVLKNQIFVPIPDCFSQEMVPAQHSLKFIVRHQILGVD